MTTTEIRQDFRAAEHRNASGKFAVQSVPKYLGYGDDPYGDELILVDGWQIGGTYHCADGTWASYGPAGLSRHHDSRQVATDVQVNAYRLDPDGYERLCDEQLAEEAAEAARREAEDQAEQDRLAAERRRGRLGDDEPGPTILIVPAYYALYAPEEETRSIREWLGANGAEDVSAVHEIRVEQRAKRRVIVFERPIRVFRPTKESATETHVVTLTVDPPVVDTPARPDLHALLDEHWPSRFLLIDFGASMACSACTRASGSRTAVVQWPCEPVAKAIANPPALDLLKGCAR